MSGLSTTPRLVKGALIGVDLFNPIASVIIFQYNPETVTRTLQPQGAGDSGARAEAMRLKGAPIETIKMDVEIDAVDQLETGERNASRMGIYPQLSAIEMLVYPKTSSVITNSVLMALGTLEILPPVGPFTVLVWGLKRVVPVRVNDLSITEELHDPALNPIRAKVSLGLRVLSYNDLSLTNPGYHLFVAHQAVKEIMSTIGSISDTNAVTGVDLKLF
jgi:hypothetical protein